MEQSNKKKFKSRKVVKIVLAIVIVLAISLGLLVNAVNNKVNELTEEKVVTDVISKQYLVKSIGATGTVVSLDSKAVTGELQGLKIDEIFVEEGDYVEKGAVLLVFESDDLEENLEDAVEALKDAQKRVDITKANNDRNVADAERNKNYQIDNAKDNIDKAKDTYDKLVERKTEAEDGLVELKEDEADAKKEFDKAKEKAEKSDKELEVKKEKYDELKDALEVAVEKVADTKKDLDDYRAEKADIETDSNSTVSGNEATVDETEKELKKLYEDAKAELEKIQKEYNTVEDEYKTLLSENITLNNDMTTKETSYTAAKFMREQQETTIETLEDNIDTAKDAHDTANKSYDFIVKNQNSTLESAKKGQELSNLTNNTDREQDAVDNLEEQLEKIVVTAPISGTITNLNYDAGDKYGSGALMIIQDCTEYEVEAYVGEYDISDIKEGQKVLVKTEATRDEELEGIVDYISPTGTKQGNNTVYKVRIKFKDVNDRLRLDMSASLSIIIAESADAVTVPYNAIQEDENGKTFVEVSRDNGVTFEKVDIEVLMESNYYTEIKLNDKIKVGDTIKIIEEKALNPLEMLGVF